MLALTLTAELNGVTDLQPRDDIESPFYYVFSVQCNSCHEIHGKPVAVSRFESSEGPGGRGEVHFLWRCKNCKREHTATIKAAPAPYKQESPPTRQKIIEIDCRGLEFLDFKAEGEFQASSSNSATKFTGIDLSEGEWYDYDEKVAEEVSVKECKWEIRRA